VRTERTHLLNSRQSPSTLQTRQGHCFDFDTMSTVIEAGQGGQTFNTSKVASPSCHWRQGRSPHSRQADFGLESSLPPSRSRWVMRPGLTAGVLGPSMLFIEYK